jgi:predicted DNA-binding antitoxin AbrB/MazE fold protein
MTMAAKYEHGVFRPLEEVTIQEGTIVEVHAPAGNEPTRKHLSSRTFLSTGCGPIATTLPTALAT